MLLNRKFINELKARVEFLEKDLESKENSVCNLLEANKELSLSNNYLENKIKLLEKVIKQHEENECRLNTELCKYKGQLDKLEEGLKIHIEKLKSRGWEIEKYL